MNKNGRLFLSMFKIGMIGFGGGTALIPVIERTVIDEYGLVTKEDYDVDVMVASITPGALPVEISAGVGRRIKGSCGLLFGAIAMALPGVMLTILFTILIGRINDLLLKQIKFIAVGIYVFIGMHLTSYISETIKSISNNESKKKCILLVISVAILVCGKNLYSIFPGDRTPVLALNTLNVFAITFFILFFTRNRFNSVKIIVTVVCSSVFVLCYCTAGIISNDFVKYSIDIVMIILSVYGILCDIKDGYEISDKTRFIHTIKDIILCICFGITLSLPALIISSSSISFLLRGLLSAVMSFGGGDAYLTVADGMFVDSGMVTKEEFYSMLAPLTNVLPGSILCKTLSGVGYYIGIEISGSVLGGLSVALAGFAISIVASCSVISLMTGLYEAFGNLNVFSELKRWIRPIVSGLLVNVILSLIVQVKHHGAEFGAEREFIFLMMAIYLVNSLVVKKYRFRNEIIVGISIILSLALCNLLVLCR